MKKIKFLFWLFAGILLCACKKDVVPVSVSGISLAPTSVELEVGATSILVATVSPADATDKEVRWSSSETSVATVSYDGVVSAVGSGVATIIATTHDGGFTASSTITVHAIKRDVTSISLSESSLSMKIGEKSLLTALVLPEDATIKDVRWSSSDEKIATVANGSVVAVAAGKTTIIAVTEDGGFTATCDVTVAPDTYPVESVSLNKTSLDLIEGDTYTLTATVQPDNATNKKIIWASSSDDIATVSSEGEVYAAACGSATITATTEDGGFTATCELTISQKTYPVEGITLDTPSLTMTEGEYETLKAIITPSNATNKHVIWKSSNKSVVTVDEDGVIYAKTYGTAIVTATTEDGGYQSSCEVKVSKKIYPVESVSLNKTSLDLIEGDTYTLTATVQPDNATNKKIIWASSSDDIATVSSEGEVYAVACGSATITATTEDGGFTATCELTISQKTYPVTGITLNTYSIMMTEGKYKILEATITPSNATNKNVTWSSSNTGVATVSNGVVTATGVGTAVITVRTADGDKTATCIVTVSSNTVNVTSVSLDKSSATLTVGGTVRLTPTINPSNATNKNVTWSSDNTGVATVSNGTVTAKAAGTATITVRTNDGGYTAKCVVTVSKEDEGEESGGNPGEGIDVEEGDLDGIDEWQTGGSNNF